MGLSENKNDKVIAAFLIILLYRIFLKYSHKGENILINKNSKALKRVISILIVAAIVLGLLPLNIIFASSAPDLQIERLEWVLNQPKAGEGVTFIARIRNFGTAPTPSDKDIVVNFYIDDVLVCEGKISNFTMNVNGGRNIIASTKWQAQLGSFTVKAVVNEAQLIDETNYANNQMTKTINITEQYVEGDEIFFDNADADIKYDSFNAWYMMFFDGREQGTQHQTDQSGRPWTFTFTNARSFKIIAETNAGGGNGTIKINDGVPENVSFKSDSQKFKQVVYQKGGLDPNQTYTITFTAAGGGWCYLDGIILLKNDIDPPVQKPDLVVTALEWTPQNPKAGQDVTFRARVVNDGAVNMPEAKDIKVDFKIDGQTVSSAVRNGLQLAKGSGANFFATTKWNAQMGQITVRAVADVDNEVDESNEANNYKEQVLNITEEYVPGDEVFVDNADADFMFEGNWTFQRWHDRKEGTAHETNSNGAKWSYTFTGYRSVEVLAETHPWGGKGIIDFKKVSPEQEVDEPVEISFKSAGDVLHAKVYGRSGLDPEATYTITFTCTGGGYSYIDGIYLNKQDLMFESNAFLSALYVDETLIQNFNPQAYEYTVMLPFGTTQVPSIRAVPVSLHSTVEIIKQQTVEEPVVVKVTSKDQTAIKQYIINFTVDETLPPVPGMDEEWGHMDVGSTQIPGTASYADGTLTIKGSGDDIWNNKDAFHFVFRQVTGNFELTARVVSLEDVHEWTKAVVMLRENLSAGSKYFATVKPSRNSISAQYRSTTLGAANAISSGFKDAQWIKVVRKSNKFESYYSVDGVEWVRITSMKLDLNQTLYAGLGITSHDNSKLAEVKFDNISYSTPEDDPLSSDASIRDLRVNGLRIQGFDPEVYEYDVELPSRHRTKTIPPVTVEVNNEYAQVAQQNPPQIPGTVVINITAEDGVTKKTYRINFTRSSEPNGISSITSWVGNTFPGAGDVLNGKWVQNYIDGAVVMPDGTIYTHSTWDEGGRTHGIYKDGDVIGNKNMNIDAKRVMDQSGSYWSIQGSEIVKEGTNVKISSVEKPSALAVANDGKLMVADNKKCQILFFDISTDEPQLTGEFGELGGISAGIPGQVTPTKFWGITGIGMDSEGYIYVIMSQKGSIIRKLSQDGELIWQIEGMSFVDSFDFDPTTDGRDIYGLEEHYVMDYTKQPGKEQTLVEYTLDANKYPNDPRLLLNFYYISSVYIRYIEGKKFMFSTGMFPGGMFVWRFEDGIAVPSCIIANEHISDDNNPLLPNQPAKGSGSWIWTDKNGNGDFEADEFTIIGEGMGGNFGWDVDQGGNIWRNAKDSIKQFVVSGLDDKGNPVFKAEDIKSWEKPKELNIIRRIQYDKLTDSLYIAGYSDEEPYEGVAWGSFRLIYRYDNWSQNTFHWTTEPKVHPGYPIRLPYYAERRSNFTDQAFNIVPQSMRVESGRLFIVFMARGPLGYSRGEMHVYDSDSGEVSGYVIPGSVVGGHSNVGWVDIPEAIKAIKTSDGSYKVLVEEDYKAKQLLYTVTPYNGMTEEDEDTYTVKESKSYKLTQEAVIDGKLDETFWELKHELKKQIGRQTTLNKAVFGTAWDDNYLYLGIKVQDSTLNGDSPQYPWEDDGVEIFIDGNNDKSGPYDSHDVQYIISWNNTNLFANNGKTKDVKWAIKGTEDGYNVEIAIPWKDINVIPAAGKKIGLDIAVNDDFDGGPRDGALVWSGDGSNFQSTERFGNLTLLISEDSSQPGTGGGTTPTGTTVKTQNNNIVISASSGVLKVEIPKTNMQQAINNAVSQNNDRIAVTFENVKKQIQLDVPFEAIKTASQNNITNMIIETGAKKITVDIGTLGKLNASQNAILEIAAAEKKASELPQNIKELPGTDKVYEFKIKLDGQEVAVNRQGISKIAKLEIPLENYTGVKPSNIVAYTIENNKLKVIKSSWYDDKEKVIKVNTDSGALIAVKAAQTKLKDVDDSKWFAEPVNALNAREIVSGFGDGSFRPDNKVTREQFIKLIVSMFDLVDQSAQSSFKDVSKDAWYYTYVASAEKLGITNGIGNGAFGAGKEITRQEMAAMVYRAMNVLGIELKSQDKDAFADIDNVSPYAREAVMALQKYGIINGTGNNKFDPINDSTRAQSAMIIYNLFVKVVNQ